MWEGRWVVGGEQHTQGNSWVAPIFISQRRLTLTVLRYNYFMWTPDESNLKVI
jgi:hypothetical protein